MRYFAVLVCVKWVSLFHVVFPITFVFWSICVVKYSISITNTIGPITLVPISQILALAFRFQPNMNTPTMLIIVMPLAKIFLSQVSPIHCSLSFLHIILPITLKVVPWWVIVHFSIAMLQIIFEISFKYASTFEYYFSFSFLFTLFPFTFISCFIYLVHPSAMPQPVFNISFIYTAIRPFIYTLASDTVNSKLPFINNPISPGELSITI